MAILAAVVLVLIGVFFLSLVFAYPFMLLWNYAVVSAISVANPIDFWVAWCLLWFISMFIAGRSGSSSSKS